MRRLLVLPLTIIFLLLATSASATLMISNVELHSLYETETGQQGYRIVDQLGVGSMYYIDRSYTITSQPALLDPYQAIMTANRFDKENPYEDYMRITLTAPATVYVAYDARALQAGWELPYWLRSWTLMEGAIVDTTDQPLQLFAQYFAQEEVVLGGAQAAGFVTAEVPDHFSNYIVYVDPPEGEGSVPEPSTMLLIGSCVVGLVGLRKKFRM